MFIPRREITRIDCLRPPFGPFQIFFCVEIEGEPRALNELNRQPEVSRSVEVELHAFCPETEGKALRFGDAQGIGAGLSVIRRKRDALCIQQRCDIIARQGGQVCGQKYRPVGWKIYNRFGKSLVQTSCLLVKKMGSVRPRDFGNRLIGAQQVDGNIRFACLGDVQCDLQNMFCKSPVQRGALLRRYDRGQSGFAGGDAFDWNDNTRDLHHADL
ncbi:MAG: hypothetical protein ACI9JL_001945 [Paracoccaceae bacterium]|jgi:hypothetical protein